MAVKRLDRNGALFAIAGVCALVALGVFLLDRREQATLLVPWAECQPSEAAPHRWTWPLPDPVRSLAMSKTPRRDGSFLFLGDRLIPLWFAFDELSEAEQRRRAWHRIGAMRLEFQLPAESPGGTAGPSAAGQPSLRLELNGPMSLRRQLASIALVLSLGAMAAFGCRSAGGGSTGGRLNRRAVETCFGAGPLVALAALAPLVVIAGLIVAAVEPLPIQWRASTIGLAWDRLDAIAPGLLLVWAICGWWSDRCLRRSGRQAELAGMQATTDRAENQQRFIRFGWLAGVTLFLFSFTRMLCWGVGTTHAWSPVGISSPFCGAVAYSDAQGYLTGVSHLISEGSLDPWNQRRPINAALFAARMTAAAWNLDIARWIQAVLVALAAAWAARELARSYGWHAATAALAFFWGCGRLFLTTTLSEPLGFALGTLALVGCLRWLRTGSVTCALAALSLMALAQSARPGALLVLPAMVLVLGGCGWGTWGGGWRRRTVGLAAASLVVAATMMVNPLISRLYGTGENMTGSNFAHTFAGLASGQSWAEVVQQHQEELEALPNEKEVAAFLYREGFRQLRDQPELFVGQLARGVMQFAIELPRFLTGITWRSNIDALFPLLWFHLLVLLALAVLSVWGQWRRRSARDWALWSAIGIGIMASVPIVFLDGGLRVLIATWPAALAWLATGLAEPDMDSAAVRGWSGDRPAQPLVIILAAIFGIAVIAPGASHRLFELANPTVQAGGWPADQGGDVVMLHVDRWLRGPGLWVGREGDPGREMGVTDWQRAWQRSGIDPRGCLLQRIPAAPFLMDQVYDRRTGTTKILLLVEDQTDFSSGSLPVELCGDSPTFGRGIIAPAPLEPQD